MFWKTAGTKPAAAATGVWGGGAAFWDGNWAGSRGPALPHQLVSHCSLTGRLDLGNDGALRPAAERQTSTWPGKAVSAPVFKTKTLNSCTSRLLLAVNARQELTGGQPPLSYELHDKTWARQLMGEDDSDFWGSCWSMGRPCWVTLPLSAPSSHQFASLGCRAVPHRHGPYACPRRHVGPCSSSYQGPRTVHPGADSKHWL